MRKLLLLLLLSSFLMSCGGSEGKPNPNPSASKWGTAKWNDGKWE